MSNDHVRPILVEQHPVTQHQYIIPTPSIDALMQKIKRLVRMHTPGAIIFAHPRFGKTYGIRYVKNMLQYDFPGVVCLSCGTEAKKQPSEDGFFSTLLEAAGHPMLSGTISRKRRRLTERIAEIVDASGFKWFVIFIDEAQRLEVLEYEWLRDVHDILERKGIRMVTLLVGQPQLLNQKAAFRQSNHTYTTQAEQWCWRTDWHLHGESAWTLFWKFALLNQMTSREVAQLVIRRGADKRATTCAKPNIDLREVRLFDTDVLAAMFRVVPPVIRRAFLLEILPGSALRSRDHLRWCMQCMARGFHSPLYQMRLTQTCPIHDCQLVECCTHCGRKIPYRLTIAYMAKPFHCPLCGTEMAPTMLEERPEPMRMRREDLSKLGALFKLHRTADADVVSLSDVDKILTSADGAGISYINVDDADFQCRYASFITQVLHAVVPGRHARQRGLRFNPLSRNVCGCWHADARRDEEEDSADAVNSLAAGSSVRCLEGKLSVYRAIRHRLWRNTLKEHQRCIRSVASRLWWHMDGERTNAFCPYAMAFIRWRMLWEGCGTPRYLFAPAATDYYGVIGWHLSRPSLAPEHWSTPTKAWVESHIYAATCVVSYNDMLAWAKAKYQTGNFTWERPKSPVNYTCLWAVAGRGCRHRPAEVYYPPPKLDVAKSLIEYADDHWLRHQAAIAGLQR